MNATLSLRSRLMTAFTLLAVVPVTILGALTVTLSYTEHREIAHRQQHAEAQRMQTVVANFFARTEIMLREASRARELHAVAPADLPELIGDLVYHDKVVRDLAVVAPSGRELARLSETRYFPATQLRDLSADEHFRIPLRDQTPYVGEVRIDAATGEPLITLAYPLIDPRTTRVAAVLIAGVRLKPLWEEIHASQPDDREIVLYLLNDTGRVIAHPDPSVVLRDTHLDYRRDDVAQAGVGHSSALLVDAPFAFHNRAFLVIAERSFLSAIRPALTNSAIIVLAALVAFLAALLFLFTAIRRIIHPIEAVTGAVQAIRNGDLDSRAPHLSNDEIGVLATAFNDMADHQKRLLRNLAELNRKQELILDSAAEGIFGIDAAGHTTFINPAAARMLGTDMQHAIGRHHHRAHHHTRADGTPHPEAECAIQDTIVSGRGNSVDEELFWRDDGTAFSVAYITAPMVDGTHIQGAVVVFRDITERREAERALMEKTRALERSNTELEQFAYAVSHDLQTPLNSVRGFIELILEEHREGLDGEVAEYLERAAAGATRMSALIHDLLEYSRVTTQGSAMDLVDSNAALAMATENLHQAIASSGARIIADELPQLNADRLQLTRLLQNLIGNAIKYRAAGRPPEVKVGAVQEGDAWHFTVQDNGIGIAPEHRERVFEVFRRLHGEGQYEGSGIGLAICKRIVERHGGQIWMEGRNGEGTTVHFTLAAH